MGKIKITQFFQKKSEKDGRNKEEFRKIRRQQDFKPSQTQPKSL